MADSEIPESNGSDRRVHERRITCVVGEVETKDKSSLALIRNVSKSGALLFSARAFDVDSPIDLLIHTSVEPGSRKITTSGTVVRCEPLDPSRTDMWRCELGVHFDQPLDAEEEELAAITRSLSKS